MNYMNKYFVKKVSRKRENYKRKISIDLSYIYI